MLACNPSPGEAERAGPWGSQDNHLQLTSDLQVPVRDCLKIQQEGSEELVKTGLDQLIFSLKRHSPTNKDTISLPKI